MEMKKEISQEIEEQKLRWHARGGLAELLHMLHNGTHVGKGDEVDQSARGMEW
jgi:hypothetical protein